MSTRSRAEPRLKRRLGPAGLGLEGRIASHRSRAASSQPPAAVRQSDQASPVLLPPEWGQDAPPLLRPASAMLTAVLAVVATLLALLWVYFSWNFDYWSKRGVKSCNPFSLFGDRGAGLPFGKPFWSLLDPVYEKYRGAERFVGTFQARQPVLVVLDPELAKTILTKEFSTFHGRGQPIDEENDKLSLNLFNINGPRWKNLRSRLSPTFTSGKLRLMIPLMEDVNKELIARVRELSTEKGADGQVEFKDMLLRYATDVIGSVAFGISCNSLKGEVNEFYKMTREVFSRSFLFILRVFLVSIHPLFVKLMPFKSIFNKTTNFFIKLMKDTVEYREANKIERNDFVHLMMQLREDDRLETDRVHHIEFNHSVMTAQAFLFFIAGLDSIANTVGFSLHELAIEPELQQRAADEVRDMLHKHGGMTYDAVKNMNLIERIIRESLRKWGPVGMLTRAPNAPFKIPDTDVVIDESVLVQIPVWQMQHDPTFFPEPQRFDPDRFTEENKEQRHSYAYLPFGEGPRFCIAERFAVLEMKLVLATLIDKFVFTVGSKTDVSMQLDTKQFSPTPKSGFWLRVEDRP
ncbi:putative cytochrome P450 6a14 [Frankliniella fusca]|uniref:Cytochrome P450 6a14 n=1 Tax=Frankliniella fusca TaxID=407009 RepID=A0AAE1H344_9NEOP|nr:putative cytochrome P450 6a14 [Frankliniella fusca]